MDAVDLFSGAGGLTIGMKMAGIQPIVCVEWDHDSSETCRTHTPTAQHYCADIRSITLAHLRGAVPVVYGGPPCQPFSAGGVRKGIGDVRNMIPDFARIISEVEPAAFIMENVPGLVEGTQRAYFDTVIKDFAARGYRTFWRVMNAQDYGVPQNRRRLIVVGFRDQAIQFEFPRPSHGPGSPLPFRSAGDVISPTKANGIPASSLVTYAKNPDLRKSAYAGHLFNGGGRPIDLSKPCPTVVASSGGNKTHWIDEKQVAEQYHQHLMNGGEPWQGHVDGARRLSVEESALIQSFPPGVRFHGSRASQYKQIGNAVPPLLAYAVGEAVRKTLEGQP